MSRGSAKIHALLTHTTAHSNDTVKHTHCLGSSHWQKGWLSLHWFDLNCSLLVVLEKDLGSFRLVVLVVLVLFVVVVAVLVVVVCCMLYVLVFILLLFLLLFLFLFLLVVVVVVVVLVFTVTQLEMDSLASLGEKRTKTKTYSDAKDLRSGIKKNN